MRVSHQLREKKVQKEVNTRLGAFLSNKIGGMLFFDSDKDLTQYYARINNRTIKTLHNLEVEGKIKGVSHKFHSIGIERDAHEHELFVPHYMNSFMITSKKEEPFRLALELKDVEDGNVMTDHEVAEKQGRIIITSASDRGKVYTAIQGADLKYDYKKKPLAIEVMSPRIALAFSDNEEDALASANHLFMNEQKIKDMQEKCIPSSAKFDDEETAMAYACVLNSTDYMFFQQKDKLQGVSPLPFFSNVASPHTSIATHAMLMDGEFSLVKRSLINELENQYNNTEERGFHETAWTMLLLGKFLNTLCGQNKLYKYFTQDEIRGMAQKIVVLTELVKEGQLQEEDPAEKLESAALVMSICDLAHALTKSGSYLENGEALKSRARSLLKKTMSEIDARGSVTEEEFKSISLAAYTHPVLLDHDEWKACFDKLLGLMHNNLDVFKGKMITARAQEPIELELFGLKSLAAIVFAKLDKEHYSPQISQILKEAVEEVLYKGIIGRPTSAYDHTTDVENETLIENKHLLNNALFLEMVRECT